MSSTRKHRAASYLTLLTILSLAAATESVAQTTAQSTQPKARHNGKIVFSSDRHYRGLSIWTINPDGSSPTRLTDDKTRTEKLPDFSPVYDTHPVWSPDGTKIAFISNKNYLFTLYVMNADGTNAQLVKELMEPAEPAWSPDGSKIAFSLGRRGTFGFDKPFTDIYVVNVDGSGLTQLTRQSGLNGSPTWSPDGEQIAFTSDRDSDLPKIWVMNADGSNQREIPNTTISRSSKFYDLKPAWSPDGTKILFSHYRACRDDGVTAIYVMNADGSNSRVLTNDPNSCGAYSSPKWSPDGTKIVASFRARTKGDSSPATQIVVMNADGSNPINISNRGQYFFNTGLSTYTDMQADWQPLLTPLKSAPSIIGFSAPNYTVNENVGRVEITVTRTGNLNDVASCLYVTLTDDKRIQHADPAATGTLQFAAGESSKTFSISVYNSHGALNNDTYRIILSDNEGNATFVGGNREATLTIVRRAALN